MKTPDEIKKALECHKDGSACHDCPYEQGRTFSVDGVTFGCSKDIVADALGYIKQLEGQIDHMLDYMHGDCGACKHRNVHGLAGTTCGDCVMEWERPNWEYAGEADENGEKNV